MNFLEKEIIGKQMAETLAELNAHFVKHNSITKDEFMDMQLKCWRKIKKELRVENVK